MSPNRLPRILVPLALSLLAGIFVPRVHGQELSLLGGVTHSSDFAKASYAWQVDYRQDFFKHFAASIA